MFTQKSLLTFAHRGEAQAFFEAYNTKPVEFYFDGLFESEHFFILITGEGPHNASEKCIAVITKFSDDIEAIYNIGIAGSLSPKLKKYDLHWIRTAYAHHAERLEFKSYTSFLKNTQHDCMSAYTRVLSTEERIKLSQFANIVDRELWAVASAAHLFKKHFFALKIISDDLEDHSADICKFVKLEAPLFSKILLQGFQTHYAEIQNSPLLKVKELKQLNLLNDPDFYFTTSQERKLISLMANLEIKGSHPEKFDFQLIRNLEISPKDRSRHLLQFLSDELNPMAKKIRFALAKKLEPLSEASITAGFDSDFESDWIQLSMKIQSSRDLEKIKNALKIFSYEEFKEVLNGKIDV